MRPDTTHDVYDSHRIAIAARPPSSNSVSPIKSLLIVASNLRRTFNRTRARNLPTGRFNVDNSSIRYISRNATSNVRCIGKSDRVVVGEPDKGAAALKVLYRLPSS